MLASDGRGGHGGTGSQSAYVSQSAGQTISLDEGLCYSATGVAPAMPPRPATPALYRESDRRTGRLLRVLQPRRSVHCVAGAEPHRAFCSSWAAASASSLCPTTVSSQRPTSRASGASGAKDPDLAALLSPRPGSGWIANKEENLRRDVERLDEAGIPTFVTDVRTVEAALHSDHARRAVRRPRWNRWIPDAAGDDERCEHRPQPGCQLAAPPRVAVLVWAESSSPPGLTPI